jgi:hypothetical protein
MQVRGGILILVAEEEVLLVPAKTEVYPRAV